MAGYSFPRFVALYGMCAQEIQPDRGVVAGCGGATTLVKVYYYRPFKGFALRNPRVFLDAYIDDTGMSMQGPPASIIVNVVQAAVDLAEVIEGTLGCAISLPKAAVVSSDSEVAARARAAP